MKEPQIGIEPMTARLSESVGTANHVENQEVSAQDPRPFLPETHPNRDKTSNELATEVCACGRSVYADKREVTLWRKRITFAKKAVEQWKDRVNQADHNVYQMAYELAEVRAKLERYEQEEAERMYAAAAVESSREYFDRYVAGDR